MKVNIYGPIKYPSHGKVEGEDGAASAGDI